MRVREQTEDNGEQVAFFVRLSRSLDPDTEEDDRVPGAELRDVIEAHKWLADRGSGKAVEVVVHHEGEGDPTKPLSTEELREIAKPDATQH